jgi:hypothetical protein
MAHRKRPGHALLKDEEDDNAEQCKVRVRVSDDLHIPERALVARGRAHRPVADRNGRAIHIP